MRSRLFRRRVSRGLTCARRPAPTHHWGSCRAWDGDDNLVFGHPSTGGPLDRWKVLKRFQAAMRRAGARPPSRRGRHHLPLAAPLLRQHLSRPETAFLSGRRTHRTSVHRVVVQAVAGSSPVAHPQELPAIAVWATAAGCSDSGAGRCPGRIDSSAPGGGRTPPLRTRPAPAPMARRPACSWRTRR
jgi:hypothetical protein